MSISSLWMRCHNTWIDRIVQQLFKLRAQMRVKEKMSSTICNSNCSFVSSQTIAHRPIDTVNAYTELLFIEITVLPIVTVPINYLNIYDAMNMHMHIEGERGGGETMAHGRTTVIRSIPMHRTNNAIVFFTICEFMLTYCSIISNFHCRSGSATPFPAPHTHSHSLIHKQNALYSLSIAIDYSYYSPFTVFPWLVIFGLEFCMPDKMVHRTQSIVAY